MPFAERSVSVLWVHYVAKQIVHFFVGNNPL